MGRTTFQKTLRFAALALVLNSLGLTASPTEHVDSCSGYAATNVKASGDTLTADLTLRGEGCNVYGPDLKKLALNVVYETDTRIHVKITDPAEKRFEIPEDILPIPEASGRASPKTAAIQFNYTADPFSFSIYRTKTKEVLFSTASHALVYEPQYLRVKTSLPENPHIYGFGEHTNPFHLPTDNLTLTLWSRDAYGLGKKSNLYGNHPVYLEHRTTGTHGVFLRNSNGMDIKLSNQGGSSLEYNVIGGVLDFYFLAGSTTDPTEVVRQYSEVIGKPAEMPYWGFGLHQCRYGYRDFTQVADVITRYADAKIPLETMWTDIDYMDRRRVFTVDPQYFPLNRMREIVKYLHDHDQKYIQMVDPAIAYTPDDKNHEPYHRGTEQGIWLKNPNGTDHLALVWPGVTVYPDWFHPKTQAFWDDEFRRFYNPENGIDIDGAWIDMNEPASFCVFPCEDPFAQAKEQNLPFPRTTSPPDPNAPIFTGTKQKRGLDYLSPPYKINNAAPGGDLSSRTAFTNTIHANGLVEYDTHNLYGTMMSAATRNTLISRRPGERPFVITRSTFAGAGSQVGKWMGDNLSEWEHYRFSIAELLAFSGIFQMPMSGSDICGFGGKTTEKLCARWVTLGAFYPFMRNHNGDDSPSQEFYLWESVTKAAQNGIDIRYRLMDYMYTAFHKAHVDGSPVIHPVWYNYPKDTATYALDLQFFYGPSILVSPVTDDESTTAKYYLPKDIFYDFKTLGPVAGAGTQVTEEVDFTEIPVHIKGGAVLPLRVESAMTTTELRKKDFEFVVAPGTDGTAAGSLYIDDGLHLEQPATTELKLTYKKGRLSVKGSFGYDAGVNVSHVKVAGVESAPAGAKVNGKSVEKSAVAYDAATKVLTVKVGMPLKNAFTVDFA